MSQSFHKVHTLVQSIPRNSVHYGDHLSLQISLEKLANLAQPLLPQPLTSFKENQPVLLVEHRLSICLQKLPFFSSSDCKGSCWLAAARVKCENYKDFGPVKTASQQCKKHTRNVKPMRCVNVYFRLSSQRDKTETQILPGWQLFYWERIFSWERWFHHKTITALLTGIGFNFPTSSSFSPIMNCASTSVIVFLLFHIHKLQIFRLCYQTFSMKSTFRNQLYTSTLGNDGVPLSGSHLLGVNPCSSTECALLLHKNNHISLLPTFQQNINFCLDDLACFRRPCVFLIKLW